MSLLQVSWVSTFYARRGNFFPYTGIVIGGIIGFRYRSINNFLDYSFYFRRLLHIRMQFDKSHRFIAKINSKGYSSDGVKTLLKMNHVLHN